MIADEVEREDGSQGPVQGDTSAGEPWLAPPSCPAAQQVLPLSHQPRQNLAEGGTTKIKVNPTILSNQMTLPVHFAVAVRRPTRSDVSGSRKEERFAHTPFEPEQKLET